MPHAIGAEAPAQSTRTPKSKIYPSRELQQLHTLYNEIRNNYLKSNLSVDITRLLESKNRPPVTKIISLGLGNLKSTDQTRRIKQLAIFLAIGDKLRQDGPEVEVYAQDPSFSKTDEAFLRSLGVRILSTPSATELGQASKLIDETTLVYSPFLTLEAYQLLFSTGTLRLFIGDDFDALRMKWPKHTTGRNEVELLLKQSVHEYRKRVIGGNSGFWEVEDKPFPMAMYSSAPDRFHGKKTKARL